jgi:hypothetical protein
MPRFLWNVFQIIIVYYEKKNRNDGKVNICQEWS